MSKIRCTIGILSHNSEKDLPRCLESIKDFAEIIVADGGSSDNTRAIAQRAGARIIDQSNPGNPIADFSLERNRLLEAATTGWFFYLDSDEVMSKELREDISRVVREGTAGAYRVRYLKTDAAARKIYRTFREYYQIRLVRTDIGARFERAVHERISVPPGTIVGQLEGAWYVPLDEGDLQLRNFARKAWKRTAITAAAWRPAGGKDVLYKLLLGPSIDIVKSLVKIIAVRVKWGRDAIPLRYELLRILYTLMQWVRSFGVFFRTMI